MKAEVGYAFSDSLLWVTALTDAVVLGARAWNDLVKADASQLLDVGLDSIDPDLTMDFAELDEGTYAIACAGNKIQFNYDWVPEFHTKPGFLRAVARHEFGHEFGLAHSGLASGYALPSSQSPTMATCSTDDTFAAFDENAVDDVSQALHRHGEEVLGKNPSFEWGGGSTTSWQAESGAVFLASGLDAFVGTRSAYFKNDSTTRSVWTSGTLDDVFSIGSPGTQQWRLGYSAAYRTLNAPGENSFVWSALRVRTLNYADGDNGCSYPGRLNDYDLNTQDAVGPWSVEGLYKAVPSTSWSKVSQIALESTAVGPGVEPLNLQYELTLKHSVVNSRGQPAPALFDAVGATWEQEPAL